MMFSSGIPADWALAMVVRMQFSGSYTAFGRKLIDSLVSELRRQANRLDPAELIEAVAIVVVDLAENGAGAGPVDAANQRFLGKDVARVEVDDGLKRHREIEVEGGAARAIRARSGNG